MKLCRSHFGQVPYLFISFFVFIAFRTCLSSPMEIKAAIIGFAGRLPSKHCLDLGLLPFSMVTTALCAFRTYLETTTKSNLSHMLLQGWKKMVRLPLRAPPKEEWDANAANKMEMHVHFSLCLTCVCVKPNCAASSARSGNARYCVCWKRWLRAWSWRLE